MSRNSQVIFKTIIHLQVVFQAIGYLAAHYTSTAADNAITALLDAQQAMSLLEMVLTEASSSQIERQKLQAIEVAYVELELFVDRLQIALDILRPDRTECEVN